MCCLPRAASFIHYVCSTASSMPNAIGIINCPGPAGSGLGLMPQIHANRQLTFRSSALSPSPPLSLSSCRAILSSRQKHHLQLSSSMFTCFCCSCDTSESISMNDMLERSSKLIATISIARNVDNAADIDADGPRQLIALLSMAMLMRMSMLPIDRNRARERERKAHQMSMQSNNFVVRDKII